jgi:hypothetical protein
MRNFLIFVDFRKDACLSSLSEMPCDIRPERRTPLFTESPTTIDFQGMASSARFLHQLRILENFWRLDGTNNEQISNSIEMNRCKLKTNPSG